MSIQDTSTGLHWCRQIDKGLPFWYVEHLDREDAGTLREHLVERTETGATLKGTNTALRREAAVERTCVERFLGIRHR